jgi:flagellar biosynthesis protein FlhF
MAQALVQVKNEMGPEAVILHTRTFHRRRWMGLRREEVVEITAGAGLNFTGRAGRRQAGPRPMNGAANGPRSSAPGPIGYAQQLALPFGAAPKPTQHLLETPAANTAMMLGLNQEMSALKKMVGDLVTAARKGQCPDVPEELMEHYLQLVQNQVAEELAADVMRTLRLALRPEQLKQPQYVQERLAEQIEKMLPVSGPIVRKKTVGPHVVALIGPTGVGKTTTLAKLAAHLKITEHHSVGLITLDTYRIAAVDQLRKYAEIIGSPLRVVSSPEDLKAAIESMSNCEFVLIDTAGRSPTDTLKLQELRAFLSAAAPDEVHLVLSSTASEACIDSAVARFGEVRVDKILFTKLDEAVHVGVVLNVVRKVNKALSYVTTGQDVPDDIEVVRGRRLAQLILSGPKAGSAP